VTAAWSACEGLDLAPERGATSLGDGSTVGREEPFESLLAGELAGDRAWAQPAMAH
jgi:hypothetical protein